MSTPKEYTGYIDAAGLELVAQITKSVKQRSYERMQIQLAHRLLDVGCGPATDTVPLAQMVSSAGQVIGVDHDEEMIAAANQKAQDAAVAEWVSHKWADAMSLPFADGYFDSSRSERVFQHLINPDQVLFEMIRVTKAGGWVVVADPDHGTISINTPELDIEQRLMRVVVEKVFNNGHAGRKLYQQFKQHGLQDVALDLFAFPITDYALARQVGIFDQVEETAIETGAITQRELDRWRAHLEQADVEGAFYMSVTLVLAAGRKPCMAVAP